MKSQGESSFPTDGHKAILNKLNNKSKTNKNGQILTIRINQNRRIALEHAFDNIIPNNPISFSLFENSSGIGWDDTRHKFSFYVFLY